MAQLQLDVRSGAAAALQAELLVCTAKGPAADLYLGWDGAMRGAGAPLLHDVFRSILSRRMRQRTRLGAAAGAVFAGTRPTVNLLRASRDNPWIANWLDDPATSWPETGCEHLRLALDDAWQVVRNRAGKDVATWGWAPRNRLSLRSPVGVGPLARWFNPAPVDLTGASDTVDAQAHRALRGDWDGAPFEVVHGPSYRLVVAFDRQGAPHSQTALPGGQDEHPAARHAFDRLSDYAAGVLRPLIPAEDSADPPLRLTPAPMQRP
jgi:acyl-homoserine lactone acylase PvdQ